MKERLRGNWGVERSVGQCDQKLEKTLLGVKVGLVYHNLAVNVCFFLFSFPVAFFFFLFFTSFKIQFTSSSYTVVCYVSALFVSLLFLCFSFVSISHFFVCFFSFYSYSQLQLNSKIFHYTSTLRERKINSHICLLSL